MRRFARFPLRGVVLVVAGLLAGVPAGVGLGASTDGGEAGNGPSGIGFSEVNLQPGNRLRDSRGDTALILEHLAPQEGDVIVDVGAGAGYFAFKLARLVGEEGLILATEMDRRMFFAMADTVRSEAVHNVIPLYVGPEDPGLPHLGCRLADKVLMVNLFTFCDAAAARCYFAELVEYVKPGGRVVVYTDQSGASSLNACPVLTEAQLRVATAEHFDVAINVRASRDGELLEGARGTGYLMVLLRR